jgi:hypothetical protein
MSVSFLTPLAGVFALAALVPLVALLAGERRAAAIRRALLLAGPRRRALVPVVAALVLLPALVATAAAQPVLVRDRRLSQRADAEVFFVLDTSLSMEARRGPGAATRLARAKRDVLRLESSLGDLPAGLASMTDRVLPVLLPTADRALFARALAQSIGIDRPPPSQRYPGRATTFEALVAMWGQNFFTPRTTHRAIVVFTDGEAAPPDSSFRQSALAAEANLETAGIPTPILFVHVWAPGERIYVRGGRVDPRYVADPTSGPSLERYARLLQGSAFGEDQLGDVARAIRADAGTAKAWRTETAATRVPLAPWFVLAGVVPLGFLLWRRNL